MTASAPPPHSRLGLSVLLAGAGSAHIVAAGELDIETAPALADELTRAGRAARRIVLDLAALTYVDPAAVALVWRAIGRAPSPVAVIPPADGAARRFLQVLRLEHTLAA